MKGAPITDLTDSDGAILFGLAREVGVCSILPTDDDLGRGLESMGLIVCSLEGVASMMTCSFGT